MLQSIQRNTPSCWKNNDSKEIRNIHAINSPRICSRRTKCSQRNRFIQELVERVKPGMVQRDNFRKLFGNKEWITKVLSIHSQIVREIFNLPPGVNYIVTNGRVTELPKYLPYFPASGFRLLEQIET